MANKQHGTLYIGSTLNLSQRMAQHKSRKGSYFTSQYNLHKLVYLEKLESFDDMLARERRLKKYNREWKLNLINTQSPGWWDLSLELEV